MVAPNEYQVRPDELGLGNEEWLVFTNHKGCRARSTRFFGNDTLQLQRIL